MPASGVDAAGKRLHLDFLIALDSVVPVVLDRIRVRHEAAVAVAVDVRAPGALGELTGIVRLPLARLLAPAKNVAGIEAKQQGEHQNDQPGAATYRDLAAAANATAAHLRRVKLGSLVVFHISPTAGTRCQLSSAAYPRSVSRILT